MDGERVNCPRCGFRLKLIEPVKSDERWIMCDCWMCRLRTKIERMVDILWYTKHYKYLKSLSGEEN